MTKKRIFLLAVALGLCGALWGFWFEPSRLTVQEHRLEIAGWPEALSGMKLALITDPHIGALYMTPEKLGQIVARTNALNVDMIVLAGDYIAGPSIYRSLVAPENIVRRFAGLHAPLGVWSVLGNHDRRTGTRRWMKAFEAESLPLLEDRAVQIEREGSSFWLLGISDYRTGPHDFADALAAIPESATILALTHSPDIFPELPARILLTFAGHTHGGQVYIPLLGRPVVPSEYGQRYARGLVKERGHYIFIGSGLGTTLLPVRFMTPPEISLITIMSAQEETQ